MSWGLSVFVLCFQSQVTERIKMVVLHVTKQRLITLLLHDSGKQYAQDQTDYIASPPTPLACCIQNTSETLTTVGKVLEREAGPNTGKAFLHILHLVYFTVPHNMAFFLRHTWTHLTLASGHLPLTRLTKPTYQPLPLPPSTMPWGSSSVPTAKA